MSQRCVRCKRPREVIRLEVCGVSSEFCRPCDFCGPAIVRELQEDKRQARVNTALNDCGTTRPKNVPPALAAVVGDVLGRSTEPGALVVIVGGVESGKTTVARGWVVGMVEAGHRALYVPAVEAMAPHADALVAEWSRFDAVAVDGLGADGARLSEWQSTRLAQLCSAMKDGRLLLTTPWDRKVTVQGQEIDGWAYGLGAPAAARLAVRARQRLLPARRA